MNESEKQDSDRIKLLDPAIVAGLDKKPIAVDCVAAVELAASQGSMPKIALEKDLFHVARGEDSEANTATLVVDPGEVPPDRNFFSDTIVPSKDELARRAYFIYLEQGSQPCQDAQNWAKAEAQIDTRPKV
jgi:hypothetical protein